MNSFRYTSLSLAVVLASAGCGDDKNPLDNVTGQVAELCGIGCPGDEVDGVKIKTFAQGNAAISGVPGVDAFFSAALNFQSVANNVSDGIDAQLALIKADFELPDGDISVKLKEKLDANLEGGAVFKFTPGKCTVDAQASLKAEASCTGKAKPPEVTLDCEGSCEVDPGMVDVQCEGEFDLECTYEGPKVACEGSCQGSCEGKVGATADCKGTCRGECDGTCDVTADTGGGNAECAGSCNGTCKGTCEVQLMAAATCEGTCRGECTVKAPEGGCTGAAHAECKAKANGPKVKCGGRCEGKVDPPSAEVQCKASAKAKAQLNVQCTPPKLELAYRFKAGLSEAARADFQADLDTLVNVRLPALLQASARSEYVQDAGEGLGAAGKVALETAFNKIKAGKSSFRTTFGIGCAVGQVDPALKSIDASRERLTESLMEIQDVRKACGLM